MAVGNPQVVIARMPTWRTSSGDAPAARALRAFDFTAPSASAPTARPSLTSRALRSSSGPAPSTASPRPSSAAATAG